VEWIKMRKSLSTDADVLRLSHLLGVDTYSVVGRLHKLWSWLDENTADGCAVSATGVFVDKITECDGFADSLRVIGWLTGDDWDLQFPNFTRHNGESAKKRAQAAVRMAKSRSNVALKAQQGSDVLSAPEKRREEKKEEVTNVTSVATTKIVWSVADGFSNISDEDKTRWSEAYPAVHIDRALAAAHEWLLANPAKARKSNWRRFVTSWLQREQDRGGDTRSNRAGPGGAAADAAYRKRKNRELREQLRQDKLRAERERAADAAEDGATTNHTRNGQHAVGGTLGLFKTA
jgi:hypothetical protein